MRARHAAMVVFIGVSGVGASCDPTHTDAIDALGPEAPGVNRGPTHRPGQPCVTCHDGEVGDPPRFTVAGTVYLTDTSLAGAESATVILQSANGTIYEATTNAVGNFYTLPSQFTPVYPMKVRIKMGNTVIKMTSEVGRDGSCADCHTDPAGPRSAGHVFFPANGVTP